MARTDTLPHFLTDVADAIREKKGTQETIQASTFDTEIENLPSGGDYGDILNLQPSSFTPKTGSTADYWWQYELGLEGMKNVELDIGNTSSITRAFQSCQWDYVPKLVRRSGSNNLTNISYLYRGCAYAKEIDLSGIVKHKINNIRDVFNGCTRLEKLDIRTIDFANVTTITSAFTGVKATCLIIVKDATAKTWFSTNYPSLTNVKTVAEYENE